MPANVIAARQDTTDPRFSNTCGKTTLVELIKCGWGKQYKGYSDFPELEQLRSRVDRLWLEVSTNGEPVLIERSFQSLTGLMKLRWCRYDERLAYEKAQEVSPAELSPIMLDRLGMPDVSVKQADGSMAKLSFPLLQRAFILHQEDSFFAILDKVEPDSRRTQIISFLTQIRSLESFQLEPEVGEVQRKVEELEEKIDRVEGFLADNGIASLIEAQTRVAEATRELTTARIAQRNLQMDIRNQQSDAAQAAKGRVEQLRSALLDAQRSEQHLTLELGSLSDQEDELGDLLGSLATDKRKLRHLRASSDLLSTVDFKTCPRCLQDVTEEMRRREEHGRCSLCARPLSRTSDDAPRAAPNEDDLKEQLDETGALLEEVRSNTTEAERRLKDAREAVSRLGAQLDRETQAFVSPALDRLIGQSDVIAKATAGVARAEALREQAEALDKMREKAGPLRERLQRLTARLESLKVASSQRLRRLRDELQAVLTAVKFPNLRTVDIDDYTLMPIINGHSYASEGTGLKGVIVLCYHLAMFNLARTNDTYFPCTLVIDSPAVGDLNDVNHAAILDYIAGLEADLTEPPTDWQIILTTRRMTTGLEPFVCDNLHAPNRMLLREKDQRAAESPKGIDRGLKP